METQVNPSVLKEDFEIVSNEILPFNEIIIAPS